MNWIKLNAVRLTIVARGMLKQTGKPVEKINEKKKKSKNNKQTKENKKKKQHEKVKKEGTER